MTEKQAIEAIYEQWESGWEALHPASPSDPDHVPFSLRNEADNPAPGALGAWARVSVIHTTAEQVTQGSAPNRKFDRRGNVFVQLFAPLNAGVALLAELADDVRTALANRGLGELNLYEGRTVEVPEDGIWAMTTVVIPFRYTDMR